MHITLDNKLQKLISIGDKVLICPTRPNEKPESGLYLPRLCNSVTSRRRAVEKHAIAGEISATPGS